MDHHFWYDEINQSRLMAEVS